MATLAKVLGIDRCIKALEKLHQEVEKRVSVVVGYTAAYAVYVHEDMEAKHAEGKQAKYLSTPLARLRKEMEKNIREDLKKRKSLAAALLKQGLRLQRESQKIVPVDTANLKNSAFTRLEEVTS